MATARTTKAPPVKMRLAASESGRALTTRTRIPAFITVTESLRHHSGSADNR